LGAFAGTAYARRAPAARVVTSAAVRARRERIDAAAAAVRLPLRAHAPSDAGPRRRASVVALAAMVLVARDVDARAVAGAETALARRSVAPVTGITASGIVDRGIHRNVLEVRVTGDAIDAHVATCVVRTCVGTAAADPGGDCPSGGTGFDCGVAVGSSGARGPAAGPGRSVGCSSAAPAGATRSPCVATATCAAGSAGSTSDRAGRAAAAGRRITFGFGASTAAGERNEKRSQKRAQRKATGAHVSILLGPFSNGPLAVAMWVGSHAGFA
jgi:hypothetical protein